MVAYAILETIQETHFISDSTVIEKRWEILILRVKTLVVIQLLMI